MYENMFANLMFIDLDLIPNMVAWKNGSISDAGLKCLIKGFQIILDIPSFKLQSDKWDLGRKGTKKRFVLKVICLHFQIHHTLSFLLRLQGKSSPFP